MNTDSVIVLRSVTHSVKAQKLLASNGINVRLIKPPPAKNGRGCSYGIALAEALTDKAVRILNYNGIPILKIEKN